MGNENLKINKINDIGTQDSHLTVENLLLEMFILASTKSNIKSKAIEIESKSMEILAQYTANLTTLIIDMFSLCSIDFEWFSLFSCLIYEKKIK